MFLTRNHYLDNKLFFAEERCITNNVTNHWHNFMEIEVVCYGDCDHYMNDTSIPLRRGSVVLSRITDYHSIFPTSSLTLVNISFNESLLSERYISALNLYGGNVIEVKNQQDFQVIEALALLLAEQCEKNTCTDNFFKKIMEAILIKLLGNQKLEYKSQSTSSFQEALRYIHLHFSENITLSRAAKLAHYTPQYFSSYFHKTMKYSFSEYLTRLRINHSKELLLKSDFTVERICTQCGFGSVVNFRRHFKRLLGVTPNEFRSNQSSFDTHTRK